MTTSPGPLTGIVGGAPRMGITVQFLNLVTNSSSVRSRTFESEGAYVQWLDSVRDMVEVVSVR